MSKHIATHYVLSVEAKPSQIFEGVEKFYSTLDRYRRGGYSVLDLETDNYWAHDGSCLPYSWNAAVRFFNNLPDGDPTPEILNRCYEFQGDLELGLHVVLAPYDPKNLTHAILMHEHLSEMTPV